MFKFLEDMREKLILIDYVKTCKIGLEPNISAVDFPMVRIVPVRVSSIDIVTQKIEVEIYYGRPNHEVKNGTEDVVRQLFEMEADIRKSIQFGEQYKALWIDTITDDMNQAEAYKMFCSRFDVLCMK